MRQRWCCLLLACSLATPASAVRQEGAGVALASSDRTGAAQDAPEFEALREIRARIAEGDREGARGYLEGLLAVGVEDCLEGLSEEAAEGRLGELDGVCQELGALREQLVVREAVHAARERLLPPDHPDLLRAKQNLAGTRYQLGDLEGAHALFEAVHAARERRLLPDHPDLLSAKLNLAATRGQLGDLEGALALKETVHAAWERLLPPDHPDLLSAKGNLAVTRYQLGDLEGAHALFEAVHAAWERLVPPGHPDLLSAQGNLAATRKQLGDLQGALALEETVHAARERLLPPDHPDLLSAKLNLAVTRYQLGDLEGAHALFEAVHAAWERLLPPDHPDLLSAKLNLAVARGKLGDLEGALALEEAVHAARGRLLPPDHSDLLSAKLNLAATRKQLGDLEGAHVLHEAVHAARERLLPPDHPDLLNAKLHLALTRKQLGDLQGALALEEAVHAARERHLPPDHPDLLWAQQNLAVTRYQLGDLEGALALEETVHAARERLLPPDHPDLLSAKGNLAGTRRQLGDLEVALALEEAVQAAWERLLPPDHPDLLTANGNLAATRYQLGDLEGALALSLSIVRALPSALEGAVTAAPREARATARKALHRLAEARSLSESGASDLEDATFEVLETARHIVQAPLHAALHHLVGEKAGDARRRLARANAELDRLIAEGPEDDDEQFPNEDPEILREELQARWRAEIQGEALRRDQALKDLLALLPGDPLTRVTASEVASSLEPGHLAVGITKLAHWRWDEERGSRVNDGSHYLAYVLLPDGSPHEVDLGPAARIEVLASEWRAAIGAPVERGVQPGRSTVATELTAGRALRAAVIDPLLDAAGESASGSTLHLCLDDALFTVPIEALPLDEGTGVAKPNESDVPRLGDLHQVRYELSMARLMRPESEAQGASSLLAVGAVDFDAEFEDRLTDARPLPARATASSARLSLWGEWDPLRGTAAELQELAAQAQELLDTEAELLRGDQVTETALTAAVAGKCYVHLATHGWYLPESVKSMLDDEPGGGRELLGNERTVTGFAPLTLCGLVLSGANAADDELARSARLLTAQELSAFDLSACDLAVLSACDTNVGVGIRRGGQGIQSLQTALHMAGARTSITSLWSVQDWPTQSLMKRFYENLWGRGMGKAEALWAAKCSLRRAGQPPRIWAGWVLAGDPD